MMRGQALHIFAGQRKSVPSDKQKDISVKYIQMRCYVLIPQNLRGLL